MPDFYPEEIDKLREAYIDMKARRSDMNGSAMGEHYILANMLRQFGVNQKFNEGSAQIENYVEHVITYGTKPELF